MQEQMVIAAKFAVDKHGTQEYGNSGLPYFYHLKNVDDLIIAAYAPKDREPGQPFSPYPGSEFDKLRAVAFLHDVLEDTDATVDDLYFEGLDADVIESVVAITKVKGESYTEYMKRVMSNDLAHKVKMCDTATNLAHSVLDGNTKRIEKYRKQMHILKGWDSV